MCNLCCPVKPSRPHRIAFGASIHTPEITLIRVRRLALLTVLSVLLSINSMLLSVVSTLFGVLSVLLSVVSTLLSVVSALLSVLSVLLSVVSTLLRVNSTLLGVILVHMCIVHVLTHSVQRCWALSVRCDSFHATPVYF